MCVCACVCVCVCPCVRACVRVTVGKRGHIDLVTSHEVFLACQNVIEKKKFQSLEFGHLRISVVGEEIKTAGN